MQLLASSSFPTMFSIFWWQIQSIVLHFQSFFQDLVLSVKLFTKRQNFRFVQIESFCRRQNKCDLKIEICFWNDKNILEKGENAGYQHFLLFPKCFQKLPSLESFKVRIERERVESKILLFGKGFKPALYIQDRVPLA